MDAVTEPIAVAVKAKAPRAGHVKTRLCPPLSAAEAAALARAFLLDAIALVRGLDGVRPALAFAPAEARALFAELAPGFALLAQRPGDLGARMRGALEDLLARGAPGAILVGSDVPTLPRGVLAHAVSRLRDADLVLGPSEDGGYYLIGVRAPRPALFEAIAWSTDTVCAETVARARSLGLDVVLLPTWFDVDTPADLDRLEAALDTGRAAARVPAAVRHPAPISGGPDARGALAARGHDAPHTRAALAARRAATAAR